MMNQISLTIKNTKLQLPNSQIVRSELYRLDKQYSPISATPHLTICLIPYRRIGTGRPIYHCKIFKILAYFKNHICITFHSGI